MTPVSSPRFYTYAEQRVSDTNPRTKMHRILVLLNETIISPVTKADFRLKMYLRACRTLSRYLLSRKSILFQQETEPPRRQERQGRAKFRIVIQTKGPGYDIAYPGPLCNPLILLKLGASLAFLASWRFRLLLLSCGPCRCLAAREEGLGHDLGDLTPCDVIVHPVVGPRCPITWFRCARGRVGGPTRVATYNSSVG